jgi:hypothetical protein
VSTIDICSASEFESDGFSCAGVGFIVILVRSQDPTYSSHYGLVNRRFVRCRLVRCRLVLFFLVNRRLVNCHCVNCRRVNCRLVNCRNVGFLLHRRIFIMTDCSSSFASGCVPWVVSPCDSACRVSGVFRLSLPVDLSGRRWMIMVSYYPYYQ